MLLILVPVMSSNITVLKNNKKILVVQIHFPAYIKFETQMSQQNNKKVENTEN